MKQVFPPPHGLQGHEQVLQKQVFKEKQVLAAEEREKAEGRPNAGPC